jgi:hypothetical protein
VIGFATSTPAGGGGAKIFAATQTGLYASADGGESWPEVTSAVRGASLLSIAASGSNLAAGSYNGVIYHSTDGGTSWWVADSGAGSRKVTSIVAGASAFFAGTENGVYVSTNGGGSWNARIGYGLTNTSVSALAVSGSHLYAGTEGGVFASTDNGTHWAEVNTGLTSTNVTALALYGSNLFAGTMDGDLFVTTDNGASWSLVSSGLPGNPIYSLGVGGTDLFAGIAGIGVWRRPLSEVVSVTRDPDAGVSREFYLAQNYPNPFNPVTRIEFRVASREFVTLKVFDPLGREVAVLVNEEKSPGVHAVTWDASKMPSGMYLCRFQAGAFAETRKMLLVK